MIFTPQHARRGRCRRLCAQGSHTQPFQLALLCKLFLLLLRIPWKALSGRKPMDQRRKDMGIWECLKELGKKIILPSSGKQESARPRNSIKKSKLRRFQDASRSLEQNEPPQKPGLFSLSHAQKCVQQLSLPMFCS